MELSAFSNSAMREPHDLKFDARDMKEAGRDYILARCGRARADQHPVADDMTEDRLRLAEIAAIFGAREMRASRRPIRNTMQAMAAGLATSDFGQLMANSIRELVNLSYASVTNHARISKPLEVRDFREVDVPVLSVDANLQRVYEDAVYRARAQVDAADGETAALLTYGALLLVSRKVVVNDDINAIAAAAATLGLGAAWLEADLVFAVLENNGNLQDGNPLFSAGADNLLTGSPLSATTLGDAVALLRRQKVAGKEANIAPAFVVVPPELEVTARQTVASIYRSDPRRRECWPNPAYRLAAGM